MHCPILIYVIDLLLPATWLINAFTLFESSDDSSLIFTAHTNNSGFNGSLKFIISLSHIAKYSFHFAFVDRKIQRICVSFGEFCLSSIRLYLLNTFSLKISRQIAQLRTYSVLNIEETSFLSPFLFSSTNVLTVTNGLTLNLKTASGKSTMKTNKVPPLVIVLTNKVHDKSAGGHRIRCIQPFWPTRRIQFPFCCPKWNFVSVPFQLPEGCALDSRPAREACPENRSIEDAWEWDS